MLSQMPARTQLQRRGRYQLPPADGNLEVALSGVPRRLTATLPRVLGYVDAPLPCPENSIAADGNTEGSLPGELAAPTSPVQ